MDDSFDPYYKWLAIPPDEQPPNHYRLLGIPLYIDDPDVISHAADQRMAHVRSFQTGKYSSSSQKILNELANARLCLLNPNEKATYDAGLKQDTAPEAPPAVPLAQPLPPPTDLPVAAPPVRADDQKRTALPRRKKRSASGVAEAVKIIGGSFAGLAIGYFVLILIGPQYDFLGLMAQPVDQSNEAASNGPDLTEDDEMKEPVARTPDPFDYTEEPRGVSTTPAEPSAPDETVEEEPSADVPSEPPPAEPTETKEEQLARHANERDITLEQGDLAAALSKAKEIAELNEADVLEAQAEFLLTISDDVDNGMRAESFLAIMEKAVAANRIDFAKSHQDNLLRLARESDDPDLVRRATRTVLKIQSMKPSAE